jgi:REP element-mobilizing transposase RayT
VAREPRIYIEDVLYYVTARVTHDRTLFHDQQDYAEYLKPLSEYKLLNGFKLYAYALMPKQLSLLIALRNNVTISTVMHNLNSRYTKIYNNRYGKKGHLFQGRFKSILVEKENYLLRLTRYIHMLPVQGVADDGGKYPYSSYSTYLSGCVSAYNILEKPDMEEEVAEVLGCLGPKATNEESRHAYAEYTRAADEQEIKTMNKLMHRTAFVGSKAFMDTMRRKVEEHIKEEEKARTIRKSNPVFVWVGSLVVLLLSLIAYNFYGNQYELQNTLNITTNGFEAARKDLANHVNTLKGEITELADQKYGGLNGLVWTIELSHIKGADFVGPMFDQLSFKGGKLVSLRLEKEGFAPAEYSTTVKENGEVVWRTAQVKSDGAKASWYGIWQDTKMRGILSERPTQGTGRDFSFVNVKK